MHKYILTIFLSFLTISTYAMNYYNSSIFNAIITNDIEQLRKIINIGASVNIRSIHGTTPLHYAASKGYTQIAWLLIAAGADVNEQDEQGNTPLHWVNLSDNCAQITQLLINNGADINTKNNNGYTLLHKAVEHRNIEIIKVLVSSDVDANTQDIFGRTCLHLAALVNNTNRGYLQAIKLLISKGADVNIKDKYGNVPLDNVRAMKYLQIERQNLI